MMSETVIIIIVVSVSNIMSAFVTGWLVFRAKKEAHEALLFRHRKKPSQGAVNIDEFSVDESTEKDTLPEAIALQNKVFGGIFGANELKERR
jgi:hypothetical protein